MYVYVTSEILKVVIYKLSFTLITTILIINVQSLYFVLGMFKPFQNKSLHRSVPENKAYFTLFGLLCKLKIRIQ